MHLMEHKLACLYSTELSLTNEKYFYSALSVIKKLIERADSCQATFYIILPATSFLNTTAGAITPNSILSHNTSILTYFFRFDLLIANHRFHINYVRSRATASFPGKVEHYHINTNVLLKN